MTIYDVGCSAVILGLIALIAHYGNDQEITKLVVRIWRAIYRAPSWLSRWFT